MEKERYTELRNYRLSPKFENLHLKIESIAKNNRRLDNRILELSEHIHEMEQLLDELYNDRKVYIKNRDEGIDEYFAAVENFENEYEFQYPIYAAENKSKKSRAKRLQEA